MNIVSRATNILSQPKPEWQRIAAEPGSASGAFMSYAVPMALLPAIGNLLEALLTSGSAGGLVFAIIWAIVFYAIFLGILFVMGVVANAVAPALGGVSNQANAMKLVCYAATPVFVGGLFEFLPWLLEVLINFAAFGYAAYLLYLGSGAVMRIPQVQSVAYTAIITIIWFILYVIIAGFFLSVLLFGLVTALAVGAAF